MGPGHSAAALYCTIHSNRDMIGKVVQVKQKVRSPPPPVCENQNTPLCILENWDPLDVTYFGTVKVPVFLKQLVSLLYCHLVVAIIKII